MPSIAGAAGMFSTRPSLVLRRAGRRTGTSAVEPPRHPAGDPRQQRRRSSAASVTSEVEQTRSGRGQSASEVWLMTKLTARLSGKNPMKMMTICFHRGGAGGVGCSRLDGGRLVEPALDARTPLDARRLDPALGGLEPPRALRRGLPRGEGVGVGEAVEHVPVAESPLGRTQPEPRKPSNFSASDVPACTHASISLERDGSTWRVTETVTGADMACHCRARTRRGRTGGDGISDTLESISLVT